MTRAVVIDQGTTSTRGYVLDENGAASLPFNVSVEIEAELLILSLIHIFEPTRPY